MTRWFRRPKGGESIVALKDGRKELQDFYLLESGDGCDEAAN
jgi:hypothetical protein